MEIIEHFALLPSFHCVELDHDILSAASASSVADEADAPRKRAAKRPSTIALIKAAQAAGLKVTAIETTECGIKLSFGEQSGVAGNDEAEATEFRRRAAANMGVECVGGRYRRIGNGKDRHPVLRNKA